MSWLRPFDGLHGWGLAFYLVAAVVVVGMLAWTIALFVASRRARRSQPGQSDPNAFLWVYLVPALDEEVTIADSVERLLAVEGEHRVVLVIDDGSTDRTPEILAGLASPELVVLRRDPPAARMGKAAALNAAWQVVDEALREGSWGTWPRDRVVIGVIDADGRLDPHAPRYVAAQLGDERVGGVQLRVRIYNRGRVLPWFQDVEFGSYGLLFQLGRTLAGTAGMGGNGQFNRVAALDAVVPSGNGGPWRDTLTEDQDLGLRLIAAGWDGVQENRATIAQQGVSSPSRLLRQRTRWAQGNLQALTHFAAVARSERSLVARADALAALALPFLLAVIAIDFILTIVFIVFGIDGFGSRPTIVGLITFYVLGIGGVVVGCVAWGSERGRLGWLFGWLVAHVYVLYSLFIWPVLLRAGIRQVRHRTDWVKTAREPLSAPGEPIDAA